MEGEGLLALIRNSICPGANSQPSTLRSRIFTIAANARSPPPFSNCLKFLQIVDRPRRQRGLKQGKVAFLSTAGVVYQKYA